MNIARRLGCRVLWLTLPIAGLHNTLRPVHLQASWVVFSQRAQGLVEPSSRWFGEGENKWSFPWGLVFLLLILVTAFLVSTWIHIWRGHRHSGQRASRSTVHFPSRGPARWVGRRLGDCHDAATLQKEGLFVSPSTFSRGEHYALSKHFWCFLFETC